MAALGACLGCGDGYQEPSPEQSAAYLESFDDPLVDETGAELSADESDEFNWATVYTQGVERMEAGDLAGAVSLFTD